MPSHCSRRTVTGILGHPGAFAQEVTVAAGCLHELPESLDFLTATLTEPLAAALQTFEMSPVSKGETGVVVGPGRLGILIVFLAVLRGLRVLAVSRSAAKRQRAEAFGAARSLAPKEAAAVVRDLTQGLGADWVVDATGHPEGLPLALSLARPRGTVAVKTTCGRPTPGLDLTRLVVDEVRIQGSRCGPFPPALQILTDHQERLKPLISSVLPLVAAQEALASADRESKVVLDAKPT
ncbi:MAG: zinc-binding dehydrogenase [Nitrospinaceae bacterium]|nr:zinc-binding dehydrogenase [Nitrospinaceae bacterium]